MINCDQIKSFKIGLPTSTHWSGYCAFICSIVNTSIRLTFTAKIRFFFITPQTFSLFSMLWACPFASLRVATFRVSLRSWLRHRFAALQAAHAKTLLTDGKQQTPRAICFYCRCAAYNGKLDVVCRFLFFHCQSIIL